MYPYTDDNRPDRYIHPESPYWVWQAGMGQWRRVDGWLWAARPFPQACPPGSIQWFEVPSIAALDKAYPLEVTEA